MLGKIKNKLSNFFSPVKGGHQDGYTFKKFIMSLKRMFPLFAIIGMLTAVLVSGKEGFGEIGWYYGSIVFFVGIIIIFTFKTLQHWNDLKNHTSR